MKTTIGVLWFVLCGAVLVAALVAVAQPKEKIVLCVRKGCTNEAEATVPDGHGDQAHVCGWHEAEWAEAHE